MMPLSTNFLIIIILSLLAGLISLFLLFYLESGKIILKRWIIWLLVDILIFACLGFVISKIESLPKGFILLEIISLLLGILYLVLAPRTLTWWHRTKFSTVFLAAETLLCWGLLGLSVGYGLLNQSLVIFLPYLLLGILLFLIPTFFIKSYDYLLAIPALRYRRWHFPLENQIPRLERIDIINVNIQYTKIPDEVKPNFEGYVVELPEGQTLGNLFHYFINFHNTKRSNLSNAPIQFKSNKNKPYGWVFYKFTQSNKKEYLDANKTLTENRVLSNETIYAESFTY